MPKKREVVDTISGTRYPTCAEFARSVGTIPQTINKVMHSDGIYCDKKTGRIYQLCYLDDVGGSITREIPPSMQKIWAETPKNEHNVYYNSVDDLVQKMIDRMAELGVSGFNYETVDDDFYFGKDDYYEEN